MEKWQDMSSTGQDKPEMVSSIKDSELDPKMVAKSMCLGTVLWRADEWEQSEKPRNRYRHCCRRGSQTVAAGMTTVKKGGCLLIYRRLN